MAPCITRKQFLRIFGTGTSALLCASQGQAFFTKRKKPTQSIKGHISKNDAPSKLWKWSMESFHYASDGNKVQCQICPNRCILSPGDRSICRSKINMSGKLYTLVYGNPCALHVDPVEKKPLYHFYPGTSVFSIATAGCNFRCLNCQNWEISQRKPEEVHYTDLFPTDAIKAAKKSGSPSIAYTYSEPVTFYEYMHDTARLAHEEGLKNLLISNGYINKAPLLRLARFIDAANIDLKSFDDGIYRSLNGGTVLPVLNSFKALHEANVWFEITTLVVPGYVDQPEMIKEMCGWILKELGPNYPLHFLRFFPRYKLNRLPATPVSTLELLRELALKEGLRYVYLGNVPGHDTYNTYCHNCHKLLINRNGYRMAEFNIVMGMCKFCKTPIPGRWGAT